MEFSGDTDGQMGWATKITLNIFLQAGEDSIKVKLKVRVNLQIAA